MRDIILSPFQGWEERLCAPLGKTLAQEQLPTSHHSATAKADTPPHAIQHCGDSSKFPSGQVTLLAGLLLYKPRDLSVQSLEPM